MTSLLKNPTLDVRLSSVEIIWHSISQTVIFLKSIVINDAGIYVIGLVFRAVCDGARCPAAASTC